MDKAQLHFLENSTCVGVCVCVCVYIHIYIHVCVCVCVCIYIYISNHRYNQLWLAPDRLECNYCIRWCVSAGTQLQLNLVITNLKYFLESPMKKKRHKLQLTSVTGSDRIPHSSGILQPGSDHSAAQRLKAVWWPTAERHNIATWVWPHCSRASEGRAVTNRRTSQSELAPAVK